MTKEEKKYFEKIDRDSQNNPMIRIKAAADYINGELLKAFNTPRGINADGMSYILSALTGVAVADIAKQEEVAMILEGSLTSRNRIGTDAGYFYMGETVDKYLYNSPMSAICVFEFIYTQKKGEKNLPDLNMLLSNNASEIGKPDVKVWAESKNPYQEIKPAFQTYKSFKTKLAPFKLKNAEVVAAFAMALGFAVANFESVFPKNLNCVEMVLSTAIFYSHMEV